jgi:tyrosine-protein kinase Etk/Wzc
MARYGHSHVQLPFGECPVKAISGPGNQVQPDDEIDPRALLGMLLDRKWLIIKATLGFLAIGLVYILVATPQYEAKAMVQVEQAPSLPGLTVAAQQGDASSPAAADAEAILTSQSVIGQAVKNLHLNIETSPYRVPLVGSLVARIHGFEASTGVNAPWFGLSSYEWGGSQLDVTQLDVPNSMLGKDLTLTTGNDGTYALTEDSDIPFSPGMQLLQGQVGQVAAGSGVTMLVKTLRANAGTRFHVVRNDEMTTIERMQKVVLTSQPMPDSNIISLSFDNAEPQVAVSVLEQIVNAFLAQNVGRNSAQASNSLKFVQQQLPEVKQKLADAQSALSAFQLKAHSVDVPMQTQNLLSELGSINNNIDQLNVQKAQVDRLYTPRHPAYKEIMQQIGQLQAQRASIEKQMTTLPDTQRQLLRLNGDVQVLNNTYTGLLNEAQQLELAQAGTVGTARIVDAPAVDITRPAKPRKLLTIFGSAFLGAFLAVAYVFLQEMFRRGLEDPAEIEQLGVEVYSAIPLSEQQIELSQNRRRLLGKSRPALLAIAAPDDAAAEAMRSLRTSLRFTQIGAPDNRLMVCSSSAQAGKTFVSANLAAVNAQAGLRVLLIDANMRDGNLHKVLGVVPADYGLSELLAGDVEVADVIRSVDGLKDLHFISSGSKPSNPSELLMRPYFGVLLKRLSPLYDLIVIDSPPILAVTDAAIIGHHVGTSLLVVRYGLNQSREVELAMQRFKQAGVSIKGVVFNGMEKRSGGFSTYGFLGYGVA